MKFSELWLREWVNPAISSEALSDQSPARLARGRRGSAAGAFNGVVVGEVVECGQHPNADKLRVTKVNVGGDRLLDIWARAAGDFKKRRRAKLRGGEPSKLRAAVLVLRAGHFRRS